jgi:predicted lipid-binding transport protein (Tim44 family)
METNSWFWILGLALALLVWLAGKWLRRDNSAPSEGSEMHHADERAEPVLPDSYSPKNVGNDASARPWEQPAAETAAASPGSSGGTAMPGAPAGFEAEAFVELSKAHFVQLQAAWDRGDIPALRAMMTAEMLAQVQPQLLEREQQASAGSGRSEVVKLEAKLLGVEEMADGYLASVEFSGLIRDEAAAGPNPFRELWNIKRSRQGEQAWLVAGVQALQ